MQSNLRLGKFFLSRWKFLEENINKFPDNSHNRKHSIYLFTCLKKLEPEEISLLASRWYSVEIGSCYCKDYDTYKTYLPIPVKDLAKKHKLPVSDMQLKLRELEKKLGSALYEEMHGIKY